MHNFTYTYIEIHLPFISPVYNCIQICLQFTAIHTVFDACKYLGIISKLKHLTLHISSKSFINIKNSNGPSTETVSRPSNTLHVGRGRLHGAVGEQSSSNEA